MGVAGRGRGEDLVVKEEAGAGGRSSGSGACWIVPPPFHAPPCPSDICANICVDLSSALRLPPPQLDEAPAF